MKMKIYVCKSSSDKKCPKGNNVVNGGWSDWSKCSSGLQRRECNNPAPASGGLSCVGTSLRMCSTKASQVLYPTVDSQAPITPGSVYIVLKYITSTVLFLPHSKCIGYLTVSTSSIVLTCVLYMHFYKYM
ncbi:coadhesin-like isoform X2 [Stylophora pistillata]|uniref:coadhesin-like isoform X2 n=1 Tax=Stylophora pistillata TaxID=50429 RepID=UPI000C04C6B2|nr:coadhesin-like isoform X2 [Stylophora pistillata]